MVYNGDKPGEVGMNEEMIIMDERKPTFFTINNELIDDRLSLEAVAVYALIRRRGTVTDQVIMDHYGIKQHHVDTALRELERAGWLQNEE
jgi:transcription initiation factor IIE alpha subunit